MSGGWSYDRLPSINESIEARDQDITDANHGDDYDTRSLLRPLDSNIELRPLSISDHDASGQRDTADRASVKSFETFETTASGSSFGKGWKNLGARIRRKPLPRYLRGSIRRHAAADIQPARIGRGVWKDQLLSDRSFRSMAGLMTVLAIGMVILVACYAGHFKNRANRNTSSVGGETESCKKVTHTNTALLLLINVCATMVLGMSNTYQQLVTSLTISDLKHVLSKFGDSRVGTNSPFSIKHKQKHRKRSWAAWVLLIFTSMPVHFLANSLIGPSYTQQLPTKVDYIPVSNMSTDGRGAAYSSSYIYSGYRGDGVRVSDSSSFPCWSAFRSGAPHFPRNIDILLDDDGVFGADQTEFDMTWTRIQVHYMTQNCTDYLQDTSIPELDALENGFIIRDRYYKTYGEGNCSMGYSVFCTLHDPEMAKCRLNVRMSAAFTLMACLVIKAIYMVAINITARGKLKEHCLTFGDVIIASASNPELRVQG
ncbi:hypothetical protein FB567DRAFT_64485 [Paraphoma chrysanthemicola]|uniref:DUF6536 domain-containing protein n=1 Tax=Paraphoma chrysanthemicola TaxID=798071 RepID=A0A8K0R3T5_9PLEO|nr:hypothetical protein FB567DRAFT_64485 [Paraphoma chrysanthemicola]